MATPPTEGSVAPIVGGSQATVGDFSTVVAVHNDESGGTCTGVLIAPNAVLTAAHCLPYTNETSRQQTIAATYVYLDTTNWNYYNPTGRKITAKDVVKHPGYISTASSVNGKHDVAIIRLATAVTDRPAARVARIGAPTSGANFSLVGYGIYNVANAWSNLLHSVSDTNFDCQTKGVPNADFLCFDRTDGTGACSGDSGSPVFYQRDHGPEVVGIHAWGSSASCNTGFGGDTRIEGQLEFLIDELGDSFVCATDGVCEASCGVADQDCIECQDDSDCGGTSVCAAGKCELLPPNETPGETDDPTKDPSTPGEPSEGPAADEPDAAGCNAGGASPSALAGFTTIALFLRRRR